MRNIVTINNITLTREQVEAALKELNAPDTRPIIITLPHNLACRLGEFMGWNLTVPDRLDEFPWALSADEMTSIRVQLQEALNRESL